jgi:hypothetical protein
MPRNQRSDLPALVVAVTSAGASFMHRYARSHRDVSASALAMTRMAALGALQTGSDHQRFKNLHRGSRVFLISQMRRGQLRRVFLRFTPSESQASRPSAPILCDKWQL